MEKLSLISYVDFIKSLNGNDIPIKRSRRSHYWKQLCDSDVEIENCFKRIKHNKEFSVCRTDILNEETSFQKLIMILFWGYPEGFKKVIDIKKIKEFVESNINGIVGNCISKEKYLTLESCSNELNLPKGLLSKFLYFYNVCNDTGGQLCIVDFYVKQALPYFQDFNDNNNDYWTLSNNIFERAVALECDIGKLEYFLYLFGRCAYSCGQNFMSILELLNKRMTIK